MMSKLGCAEEGCNNKVFRMDQLTIAIALPVCRKHWYMFNYGYSEQEASRK